MIPAINDGGLGLSPTRRPPKIANQNVLLNALQNVAGGWTAVEDNGLDHEDDIQADVDDTGAANASDAKSVTEAEKVCSSPQRDFAGVSDSHSVQSNY